MLKLMISLVPEIKKPDVLLRSVSQPIEAFEEKNDEAVGGVEVSFDVEDDEE